MISTISILNRKPQVIDQIETGAAVPSHLSYSNHHGFFPLLLLLPPSPTPPPPRPTTALPVPLPSPSSSPKHETLPLPAPESKPLSPPKKSPPLPWTHQETLALIQAYQEKWYSLKKGQLKAFQWEEVAVTVAARCGFDEPTKTSTQCRHKIEKLRKRYRSELQKPYPNSWQYFELMDQMERGPMPLNARPVAVVKSSPNNANSNSNNSNNMNHGYGSLYSSSADYYNNINNNNSRGDGGGGDSDDSDEEWGAGYGVEAASKNKSKSINNIVRGDVKSGVRSAKRVAMERGFSDVSNRVARVLSNPINGKRKQYYDGDDSDDDNDSDDDDDDDSEEDVEEEQAEVEEGEEGGGGMELASEIRGFAERFMRIENKKIELMRETERYRMEMEKKRMEMILEGQRKIIDTIGRAFGAHKRAKMAEET
ncbi:hypothetical protein Salat_0381900 [Sesamum alatum]|uniref:Myb-like domain-containing protein n=1 Tax=Sesamum alatum TaxID=300844 RepID=A0AAE1Z1A2_9LAMI|nr:hypothetical protein Salat_0381900 [Sesamum alatum]